MGLSRRLCGHFKKNGTRSVEGRDRLTALRDADGNGTFAYWGSERALSEPRTHGCGGERKAERRNQADGKSFGRPGGLTVDPRGALIVADDLSNTIWRVTPPRSPGPTPVTSPR